MRRYFNRFRLFIIKHQLVTAICLVLVISLFLTTVSMILYVTSGASGLDLSRPGFNVSRQEVQKTVTPDFKETGSLTKIEMAEFKKLYDDQRRKIKSLGSFDDNVISDESLGLYLDNLPVQQTE